MIRRNTGKGGDENDEWDEWIPDPAYLSQATHRRQAHADRVKAALDTLGWIALLGFILGFFFRT